LKPRAAGFYVDVGAYHPTEGSNTYKLYLKGWSGITIEPNPEIAPHFRKMRPRDRHVALGVSRVRNDAVLWHEFALPSMNTLSPERAAKLQSYGHDFRSTRTIVCRPLQDIIDEFASGQHLDLLSIDCEGMDLDVLQSLDFSKTRPTSVLIEDFDGYYAIRDCLSVSPIQTFMRQTGYRPIAQILFTALYVAENWRDLMKRSGAFDTESIHGGLLP
jgi:FkbM family methyltransferase